VGKWATYQKRGGNSFFGMLTQPGPSGVDWNASTGGVGVITVTRLANLQVPAVALNYRAIDTTTNLVAAQGGTLTGLVSGRAYRCQAAWVTAAAIPISDWSVPITVNAG
jgi:hypothetical protein